MPPSNDGIHVPESFRPTNPPLTNGSDSRRPDRYARVVKQFDVESNPRYTPNHQGKGETYCNIFLWDVTKAMCCEVPHWVDAKDNPTKVGKGHEHNANAVCDWLAGIGTTDYGWKSTNAAEAIASANRGCPVVVAWKNPKGIGHVAVVIPSNRSGVRIAQAGKKNFYDKDVKEGFGSRSVLYYCHA